MNELWKDWGVFLRDWLGRFSAIEIISVIYLTTGMYIP